MGPVRSTRFQKLQVFLHEVLSLFLVLRVKCKNQQFSESIGVDVSRRVEKVRNITPPNVVVVSQSDTPLEHVLLGFHPKFTEMIRGQLTFGAASGVDPIFEAVHGHLAENGGHDVVDLAHNHGKMGAWVVLLFHEAIEHQHFSKS